MLPKKKTMLLVACAVSAGKTVMACSDNTQSCFGFYPTDAAPVDATADQGQACFGFYPTDAAFDVAVDASSADADADAAEDGGDE